MDSKISQVLRGLKNLIHKYNNGASHHGDHNNYMHQHLQHRGGESSPQNQRNLIDELARHLAELELHDENFHNYAIVQEILGKLEENFGQAIDLHVKEHSQDVSVEDAFISERFTDISIAEAISSHPRFSEIEADLVAEISNVVNHLMCTSSKPAHTPLSTSSTPSTRKNASKYSRASSFHFNNPTTDSNCSEFSWSDSMSNFSLSSLSNRNERKNPAANLNVRNSVDVRLAAIEALEKSSPGDLVCSEHWVEIRKSLGQALSDPDSRISSKSLELHARLFRAAPPELTCEIYMNLAMHLISVFQTDEASVSPSNRSKVHSRSKRSDSVLSHGNDFAKVADESDPVFMATLRKFRLLHRFQEELPNFWIHFRDTMSEEMYGYTFRLLSLNIPTINESSSSSTSYNLLSSPLIYMALVDPCACWFERWIKETSSRKFIIGKMLETPFVAKITKLVCKDFLPVAFTAYRMEGDAGDMDRFSKKNDSIRRLNVDYLSSLLKNNTGGESKEDAILSHSNISTLYYLILLQCVSILGRTVVFEEGRNCYPLSIQSESSPAFNNRHSSYDVGDVISALISHLTIAFSSPSLMTRQQHYRFVGMITEVLKDAVHRHVGKAQFIIQHRHVKELMAPLESLLIVHGTIGTPSTKTTTRANERRLGPHIEDALIAIADIIAILMHYDSGHVLFLDSDKLVWKRMKGSRPGSAKGTNSNSTAPPPPLQPDSNSNLINHEQSIVNALAEPYDGSKVAISSCIHTILRFCELLLDPSNMAWGKVSSSVCQAFLEVLKSMSRSFLFSMWMKQFGVIEKLAKLLDNEGCHKLQVLDVLIESAWLPEGVRLLSRANVTDTCVGRLVESMRNPSSPDQYRRGQMFILSQFLCTAEGHRAVIGHNAKNKANQLLEKLLCDIDLCVQGSYDWLPPDERISVLDNAATTTTTDNDENNGDSNYLVYSYRLLASILSAPGSASAWPLLCASTSVNDREMLSQTLGHILNKYVLLDEEAKRMQVPNFEDDHKFGLELLRMMVLNLDCLLFLQATYDIRQSLYNLQTYCFDVEAVKRGQADSSSTSFAMNECSLLRNYLLVHSFFIGGPNERRLPCFGLFSTSRLSILQQDMPVLFQMPPSKDMLARVYSPKQASRSAPAPKPLPTSSTNKAVTNASRTPVLQSLSEKQLRELAELKKVTLSGDKSNNVAEWFQNLKDAYLRLVATDLPSVHPETTSVLSLLAHSLLQSKAPISLLSTTPFYKNFRVPKIIMDSSPEGRITSVDALGIDLIMRYGEAFSLVNSGRSASQSSSSSPPTADQTELGLLLPLTKKFTTKEDPTATTVAKKNNNNDNKKVLDSSSSSSGGFDWFASIIFLLFGEHKAAYDFLVLLSHLPESFYLWPKRVLFYNNSNNHVLAPHIVAHLVECIIKLEMPCLYSRFVLEEGFSISQILLHWLNQSFLNYLDLQEIIHMVLLSLVLGIDYHVYFCVCAFKCVYEHRLSNKSNNSNREHEDNADDGYNDVDEYVVGTDNYTFQDEDALLPSEFHSQTVLRHFKTAKYLPEMHRMAMKYRQLCLKWMSGE